MKTYLYLDDIRTPKTDEDWVIVRSFDEATEYVAKNGIPDFISFDNDLGFNQKEGYDFAKWLVEKDMNCEYTIPDGFDWFVHSANPVAVPRINSYLSNYLEVKNNAKFNTD